MIAASALRQGTPIPELNSPGSDGTPCSCGNNGHTSFAVRSGLHRNANEEVNCGWTLPNGDVEDEFTWLTRNSFKNSWLLSLQITVQLGQFVHAGKGRDCSRVLWRKPCQGVNWFSGTLVCLTL